MDFKDGSNVNLDKENDIEHVQETLNYTIIVVVNYDVIVDVTVEEEDDFSHSMVREMEKID